MKNTFMQEMARFWRSLQYIFGVVANWLRGVIANPNSVSKFELAMLILTAVIVAALLVGGLVSFIKAPRKKKWRALGITLLVLILLAAVVYFLLRMIGMPTA